MEDTEPNSRAEDHPRPHGHEIPDDESLYLSFSYSSELGFLFGFGVCTYVPWEESSV